MVSALNVATVMVRSTGDSGCTIQELAGLVWNKCTTIFESARACCSYEMWYDCKWLECSRPMAVSASPTARAVRTACFAEQMEQKKQLLIASSGWSLQSKKLPPSFSFTLRALGSHSALHANIPRKGGPPGGRGVRGPDFFRWNCFNT